MLFTPLKFRQAQIYKQLLNTHLKKKKLFVSLCVCHLCTGALKKQKMDWDPLLMSQVAASCPVCGSSGKSSKFSELWSLAFLCSCLRGSKVLARYSLD